MLRVIPETPSRIWRRIEAVEGRDMPSLPSLPQFEDSQESSDDSRSARGDQEKIDDSLPMTSTPACSYHTAASTARYHSSASSTARFGHSIASRSTSGKPANSVRESHARDHRSFDVSMIPSVTEAQVNILRDQKSSNFRMDITRDSLPDIYLPPDDEDIDALEEPDNGALVDGLAFASGTTSPCVPIVESKATPQKKYDYSDSIRSEPKVKEFHPSIPLSNLTSKPPQP